MICVYCYVNFQYVLLLTNDFKLYLFLIGLNVLCWLFLTYNVMVTSPIDNVVSKAVGKMIFRRLVGCLLKSQ